MGSHGSPGSIYKLTCVPTGKCYVGQTRDTKTKAGRPYAYGVTGRWNDHCSCPAATPLGLAIAEYGREGFMVETLETNVADERLDEREAYWITALNTMVPNGYNKMRHGRCRHREESTLSEFYVPTTVGIRLRQIKRDGAPHLIYAYLLQENGDEIRVVFGQGNTSNYAEAVADAQKFLVAFSAVPIEADPRILDPGAPEYSARLARFDGSDIHRIRVAKWNNLCAVHVDKERVCFGGKLSTFEQATAKALQFAHALLEKHPMALLINDVSKSATGGCS